MSKNEYDNRKYSAVATGGQPPTATRVAANESAVKTSQKPATVAPWAGKKKSEQDAEDERAANEGDCDMDSQEDYEDDLGIAED
jgi:hypothetical protein